MDINSLAGSSAIIDNIIIIYAAMNGLRMPRTTDFRFLYMAASKRDSIDAKKTEDVAECADASCHDPVVGRSQFCKRHRDKQYKERHRKRKKTQAVGQTSRSRSLACNRTVV